MGSAGGIPSFSVCVSVQSTTLHESQLMQKSYGQVMHTGFFHCALVREDVIRSLGGIDNATSVWELATLASAEFTASPAGVDQPQDTCCRNIGPMSMSV